MNYDIHVGAVLGLPGKMLAFFASLIIASLPITGTLIWWGRRKKSKQSQNTQKASVKHNEMSSVC
ncbi:PepSY domain-containing protein [Polluticoccus soli]|uniref:PepSY domain-containing protein n=1 Tax=Polluticoccus soli TaxID=3034150 RepID=UPI0023E22A35|nr:PepSY-associated TM helix domain-containing protein [Flavipsychrobacter sp. JY13-12]